MTEIQHYEQQISQSPVFFLEKGTAAYASAAIRLKELLFYYLIARQNKKLKPEERIENFGLEIFEVATACIEGYDPSRGKPFIHYFNHSWKLKYDTLLGDTMIAQEYGGIHFTDRQKKMLFLYDKVCKIAAKEHLEVASDSFLRFLAENTGWNEDQCAEVRKMAAYRSVSETQSNDEDDLLSLFDMTPSTETAASSIEQQSAVGSILAQMDGVYHHLQQRQQALASSLFTIIVLREIGDYILSEGISLNQYSFCNHVIVERYNKNGVLPLQKELAIDLGVAESQISRTTNTLLAKIRVALAELE